MHTRPTSFLVSALAGIAAGLFAVALVLAGCAHPGAATLAAGQCILDSGVMGKVLADLGSANYASLIADAITSAPALVKCALQAIAAGNGTATGSATPATSQPTPLQLRAREMLDKHFGSGQ